MGIAEEHLEHQSMEITWDAGGRLIVIMRHL